MFTGWLCLERIKGRKEREGRERKRGWKEKEVLSWGRGLLRMPGHVHGGS